MFDDAVGRGLNAGIAGCLKNLELAVGMVLTESFDGIADPA